MNRRSFIRGLSVMALASRLSFTAPQVEAMSVEDKFIEIAEKMSEALAYSMLQTRGITTAQALLNTDMNRLIDNAKLTNYSRRVYATQAFWKV